MNFFVGNDSESFCTVLPCRIESILYDRQSLTVGGTIAFSSFYI